MVLQNRAKLVRRFALAFLVGLVFTSYGLLCSWQSVEAPNRWNHTIPIVLLLPIGALSTSFRKLSSDGHLSVLTYRLVLVLGAIAQFLYYYAIIAAIRWALVKIIRPVHGAPGG